MIYYFILEFQQNTRISEDFMSTIYLLRRETNVSPTLAA